MEDAHSHASPSQETPAQGPKAPLAAATPSSSSRVNKTTTLSCTTCRRRKIKCDRGNPCSHCMKNGEVCFSPQPSGLPRGRQGGRRRRNGEPHVSKPAEGGLRELKSAPRDRRELDSELLTRITRLETLLENIDKSANSSTPPSLPPDDRNASDTLHSDVERYTAREISPKQNVERYLGGSLWKDLSAEISGIREVLYDSSSGDEDDWEGFNSKPPTPQVGGPAGLGFLLGASNRYADAFDLESPTLGQRAILCNAFITNVDPAVKILHVPSLRRFFIEGSPELAGSPGVLGVEALQYAIYYAATTSLNETECLQRLGDEKAVLLRRFRACTEMMLEKADFVNTTELSTLQALVIYLFTVRSNENSRRTWTLTSLAVRIAQALSLHMADYGGKYMLARTFDREIRSRTWWQICVLDRQSSIDRGSDPIITLNSFSTPLPINVDDADLHPDNSLPCVDREGYTDLTLCLLSHEAFMMERRLNYVPARDRHCARNNVSDTFEQRVGLVEEYQRRIERRYLRHCSDTVPVQRYTRLIGNIIIATFWLFVYRPLQRYANAPSFKHPHSSILKLAVEVIELNIEASRNPDFACFKWISTTWVQWHALAVLLAELCVQTTGPNVERAWLVVDTAFEEASRHVADSEKGRLWLPVKKLMNKAQTVRQHYLNNVPKTLLYASQAEEQATPAQLQSMSSLENQQQPQLTSWNSSALNQDFTYGQPSQSLSSPQNPSRPDLRDSPSALAHWDNWHATEPLSQLSGQQVLPDALNSNFTAPSGVWTDGDEMNLDAEQSAMSWMTWEGFLENTQSYEDMDFELETNPMPYLTNW